MRRKYKDCQLFFLPFAGGLASSYDPIISNIHKEIEVYSIEYPGHGKRYKEPFVDTIEELIRDSARQINEKIAPEKEIILFGYSLGTIISYEIIRQNLLLKKPVFFFAAAQEDLKRNSLHGKFENLSDEQVIQYTINLGGIDSKLVENKRFLHALLLPTKHDYLLRSQYVFNQDKAKIDCETIIIYSKDDTPRENIIGWKSYIMNNVEFYEFEGNHFFLNQHLEEIAEIINRTIVTDGENNV